MQASAVCPNHLNFRLCCDAIFKMKKVSNVMVGYHIDTYAGYCVMLSQTNQRRRKWQQMMVSDVAVVTVECVAVICGDSISNWLRN